MSKAEVVVSQLNKGKVKNISKLSIVILRSLNSELVLPKAELLQNSACRDRTSRGCEQGLPALLCGPAYCLQHAGLAARGIQEARLLGTAGKQHMQLGLCQSATFPEKPGAHTSALWKLSVLWWGAYT